MNDCNSTHDDTAKIFLYIAINESQLVPQAAV